MRVVLYLRVSSDKQAEKDLSIPAQREAARKYCLERGWEIVAEYEDAGKSARSDNRPQFQEMIAEAKKKPKQFDAIIVWKFSRFARNRDDSYVYKSLLAKRGIQVISINEKIDPSPAGKLLEAMIESMDEFFSANLASDTIRGMKANVAKGYRNGGSIAPGYKAEYVHEGKNRKTKIVPDPVFTPIIQRIFKMYLEGFGMKEIAKALNAEGIKNKKGKVWATSQISYILKNETYIGNVAWNKLSNQRIWRGEAYPDEQLRFEGVHEAIITKDVFERVQARMSERGMTKKIHPRAAGGKYLLTPLVRCSKCGATYQGATAKSGKYHYYSCRTKVKKGAEQCRTKLIPVALLEGAVIQAVKDVVLVDKAFVELVKKTNEELSKFHMHNGHSVQVEVPPL